MAVGSAGGTYVTTLSPRSDADYRAVFGTPSNEGINGDTSPTVSVLVFSQCGSVSRLGAGHRHAVHLNGKEGHRCDLAF